MRKALTTIKKQPICYVIAFTAAFLFFSCTASKTSRIPGLMFPYDEQLSAIDPAMLDTNSIIVNGRRYKESNVDVIGMAFHERKTYFVMLHDQLFEIGSLAGSTQSEIKIQKVKSRKELYQVADSFATLKKIADVDTYNKKLVAFDQQFRIAEAARLQEQRSIIASIREQTRRDKRERGCFLKVVEDGLQYRIVLENSITVGKHNEVDFFFPTSDGVLTKTNSRKELIIATLHSHTHDRGLSGMGKDEMILGKGDMANVKLTEIPWITIGPDAIHAGYLDAYGYVHAEQVNTENLVIYALKRTAKKL